MDHSTQLSSPHAIGQYWPLIALILASILAAFAISWHLHGDMLVWMHYFMGIFLVNFSILKIFHPRKFADGFQMYDILAKRLRLYAYIYPLIELCLGLAYLAFAMPIVTYLVTIVILSMGTVGVIKGLQEGLNINCPCMGSVLEVPLSTITLIENISMVLMAFILLVMSILRLFV